MSSPKNIPHWLRGIECPKFFDFEAALTAPCVSDDGRNPPLHDYIYDSDDESKEFFRAMEADPSRHQTPCEQDLSPLPPDLRQVKPLYRHRPQKPFEELLREFQEVKKRDISSSKLSTPRSNRSSGRITARTHSSEVKSSLIPRPPSTPRRERLQGVRTPSPVKPASSRTSARTPLRTPNGDSKNGTNSRNRSRLALTPSRIPKPPSPFPSGLARPLPVSDTPAPARQQRLPERVSPPVRAPVGDKYGHSKPHGKASTTGKRLKSRAFIDHCEGSSDGKGSKPLRMDRIEPPPTGRGEETGDNRGNKEHSATGEQKNRVRFRKTEGSAQPAAGTGKDLADPEFLRLMEEHNRKIRRKQSQSGGGSSSISEQSNNDRKVSEGSPLLVSLRSNSSASVGGSQKEHRGGGFKSQRRPLSEQQPKALSSEPIDCDDDLSLTELLKSENDRVLEARRKRAADRQKEIQANKTNVLRNFEGDLAARRERQLKRTSAKVEFTLAKNMSKPRVQTMKTTTGRSENVKPSTEKETKVVPGVPRLRPVPVSRQGHLASQRPRGLQGLKSRSKSTMSNAASVSSSGVSSPKNRLAHLGLKSRALSSTTPDILKDTARQKRAGKRMEIDLQSLLSKHNSQVAGNKRGLVMVKP